MVTVVPQAGYTGATACSTTPVTFYAYANVGCVNAYSWTKPSSWTEVSRNGNSITLKPSGTLADVADIKATITFTCGSTVNGTFKPQFNNPIISTPSAICYSGTTVSLTNVGPGTSVLWTTGSNMSILSGNGTPTINVRAISAITRETGIIQASVSCSDAQVPAKNVWVGKPLFTTALQTHNTQLTPGMQTQFYANASGATSVSWVIPTGCYQHYCWELLNSYVLNGQAVGVVRAGKPGYYGIEGKLHNGCGIDVRSIYVNVQNPRGGGGGGGGGNCGPGLTISPNPSVRGDITVNVIYHLIHASLAQHVLWVSITLLKWNMHFTTQIRTS